MKHSKLCKTLDSLIIKMNMFSNGFRNWAKALDVRKMGSSVPVRESSPEQLNPRVRKIGH